MGDPSGGQVPGGANFGDIKKQLGQMGQQGGGQQGQVPRGQMNPAPPAGPQRVGVPGGGAGLGGMTMSAPPPPNPVNPYNSATGKPAFNAGGAPGGMPTGGQGQSGQSQGGGPATPSPQPAVKPGTPIGPEGGQTQQAGGDARAALLGAGAGPRPQNPSPNGPRGQNGMMPQRGAVGAPQAGGFQQPNFGQSGSGSAGMPNVANPYARGGPTTMSAGGQSGASQFGGPAAGQTRQDMNPGGAPVAGSGGIPGGQQLPGQGGKQWGLGSLGESRIPEDGMRAWSAPGANTDITPGPRRQLGAPGQMQQGGQGQSGQAGGGPSV